MANSENAAPEGAVWSESTPFAQRSICLSKNLVQYGIFIRLYVWSAKFKED